MLQHSAAKTKTLKTESLFSSSPSFMNLAGNTKTKKKFKFKNLNSFEKKNYLNLAYRSQFPCLLKLVRFTKCS